MNFVKHKNYFSLFSFLIACACMFSFASCDAVFCDEPPEILNAQPDLQVLRPPFPNGTNINYNCVDGFALQPGANLYVVCLADNETAIWSRDGNVMCTQVCGDLPSIPHATLVTEGKSPPFHPGVKITVSCDSGYVTGGILIQIKCVMKQGNAEWDFPADPCKPRSCGFPGDIENAQRIGNVFSFPSNVSYKCKEGFKMKGRATIFCLPTGNWNPSLPSCDAIVCPLLPHPRNGRVISPERHYGSIATYECERGFRVEGPSQRTCGADSQWSENPPSCTVIRCLPPGEFENGRVVNAKEIYVVGDFVIFVCRTGEESRTSSKCLESGQWSSRPPSCPVPPDGSTAKTAVPPTVITITPPTKVTTNSPGNRNASMCEDPGNIPHGKRTTSGFSPGGNVTYTCEDGYDLRGKATLVCLGTGKWDLDKLPICVEPIPITVIVGIVVGIILLAVTGIIAYYCYRWRGNNPKGYGKKSKALAADATDMEEIDRLDKYKKPIPVTVL